MTRMPGPHATSAMLEFSRRSEIAQTIVNRMMMAARPKRITWLSWTDVQPRGGECVASYRLTTAESSEAGHAVKTCAARRIGSDLLRHQHRVDDVNHAVRCADVGFHDGGIVDHHLAARGLDLDRSALHRLRVGQFH